MPSNSPIGLKIFNKQLERKRLFFHCPRCNALLLSKNFQKHCAQTHNLNPLLCCVWCWGKTTWKAGKKCRNVDHMIQCWQDFMTRYASPTHNVSPSYNNLIVEFDTTPMCPKQNFFSIPRLLEYADRFYDPIWPVTLCPDGNTLTFSGCDGGLDLAASCIRLFIRLRKTMDFRHVMVRNVAFPSFARAMDNDEGISRTLPFWTLCDGGKWPKAKHRQHRHMIIVSPKGYFYHRVWNKVCPENNDRPRFKYKCKASKPFESTLHFIHTLGYLSRRESNCKFTIHDITATTTQQNHFYIYTPLPKNYELVLATQYKDGILEHLRWKYSNFAIDQLLCSPVEFVDQKWRMKIKHLRDIPLGIRLPISEDLVPCFHQTTAFLHLTGDKKMYFERGSLSQNTITFYHAVGEEYFTFQKRHQRDLNLTKPMAAEIARLKEEMQHLTTEMTRLNQQVAAENTGCKRKCDNLTVEMTRLVDAENSRLKQQVDNLTAENSRFKQLVDDSTAETTRLKQQLDDSTAENSRLKQHNQKLCRQNTRLQRLLQNETTRLQRWKRTAQKKQRKNCSLHQKINKLYEAEMVRYREEIAKCKEEIRIYKEELLTYKNKLKGWCG